MDQNPGEYLHIPGSTLYYHLQGKGPVLLLIAGGSGGSHTFMNLIPKLARSYTVISYDRRGAGESTIETPEQDVTVGIHADDAHWLLAALTNKPAYVFGTSAGALIALDLTARFPEQVRRVIAHEPPAAYLLGTQNTLVDFQPDGTLDSFRKFAEQVGVTYDEMEPGVSLPQANPDAAEANARSFFRYTAGAVQHYRLDFDALQPLNGRVIIGGGLTGRDAIGYAGAVEVARRLAVPVTDFPSNHTGYVSQPTAFAEAIHASLSAKA